MITVLKIAIILAGIWAALSPIAYGFISIIVFHSSAFIDILVFGSCVVLVWEAFSKLPRPIWVASMVVLLGAANIGFVHYFRDFGSSGPLPYEWLNGYYKNAAPLIVLSFLHCYFRRRYLGINKKKIAEQTL
jgi:hypothetical protein